LGLRELNDSGRLARVSLLVFSTHGLAAGELDMLSRVGERNNIGIPLVGDAATEYIRQSAVGLSKSQLEALRGSLLYMWFKREVPDTRFRASPGLVLTSLNTGPADAQNDGFLSANEIAALDLNADLVILSACNTASQDDLRASEVVLGLTESFMAA